MDGISRKFNLIKLWISKNDINMSEELNIIDLLNQKYQFRNLANYARNNNMTEQGILKQKKNQKQQYIIFGNQNYYF